MQPVALYNANYIPSFTRCLTLQRGTRQIHSVPGGEIIYKLGIGWMSQWEPHENMDVKMC